MNSKMLMLGILLIAGLSFAQPPNWNWMEYVALRYYCNDVALLQGNMDLADAIGEEYFSEEFWEYEDDARWALYDDGGASLCYYSGCWESETMSTSGFRSKMAEYNTAAFNYNFLLRQGIRNALSDPEYEGPTRQEIVGWLAQNRNGYINCINEYSSNPCYGCQD